MLRLIRINAPTGPVYALTGDKRRLIDLAKVPPPDATLDEIKRWHARRSIAHAGGNRTAAAETLGVARNWLWRVGLAIALLLWVLPGLSHGIAYAQTPAKCADLQTGAWMPADSTTTRWIDSAGDSLYVWQDATVCVVAGQEWLRKTAPPTTPAGAFILIESDDRAYMRVSITAKALPLEILAPWYELVLKPLRRP